MEAERKNKGFGIVLLMCFGIFVCMIDTTIMNIALPAIQSDLHASLETMSWILNVYTIAIAVLSIPLARMAELFGKAKFFLVGAAMFALGSALCGFANSGEFLIAARLVQSIGASILMPVSMIIGVSAVPVEKRHLAQGLLGSTQGLAAALGPAVGGIITQTIGWSWVFYVNVPICLVAIVLGVMKLQIRGELHRRTKIDLVGVCLSSVTIFLLTLVLVKGNDWGWQSTYAWVCYVGVVVAGIAFLVAESKVKDPMVNLVLFRHRQFSAATFAMVAGTVYMVGVTVLLPQFLTHFQDKTELQAAWLLTPVSATIFFVAPISGLLARKLGNFGMIFSGFISLGLSYWLLQNLGISSTALHVIFICILLGAGFGFEIGPASTASAGTFEGELLTASQSVTQMFRQVGVVLAVAISVSGLTHNIAVQKHEIVKYASMKADQLNVPDSVKAVVLANATNQILHSDWNTNADTAEQTFTMSEMDRQSLIATNVNSVLSTMSPMEQKNSRPAVVEQVTKQVDQKIQTIAKQVNDYKNDIQSHAKSSIALSFSNLYRTGFPVVLASVLISFFFLNRRKSHVPEPLASHTGT